MVDGVCIVSTMSRAESKFLEHLAESKGKKTKIEQITAELEICLDHAGQQRFNASGSYRIKLYNIKLIYAYGYCYSYYYI